MDKIQHIACSFPTETALYLAYMPFIKGGGLFIRTQYVYCLGDLIELSVHLIDESEPYLISGKVVWITPQGAQGNKPCGIGVQCLGDKSRDLCSNIENYLAAMLESGQATDTM